MKLLKSWFQRLMYFLRLTDDDGLLSITNIACIVVLVKVATASEPSIVDMGSLLIALSMYYGKKVVNKHKKIKTEEQDKVIEEIKTKVQQVADKTSSLSAAIGLRNPLIK